MIEPSPDDAAAAERLGVSTKLLEFPLIIARLCGIIDEMKQRLDTIERGKRR